MIDEPWYREIASLYGEEYARIAGYFDETKPWTVPYGEVFDLPRDKLVLQFSGAFHPFHEGHLDCVEKALQSLPFRGYYPSEIAVVIHLDHSEYRTSKGRCSDENVRRCLELLDRLDVSHMVVDEDKMPGGCSRNFTRLYAELERRGNRVVFLSGGDRANYALTFRDRGECIIVGRSTHPNFTKWSFLASGDPRSRAITFVEANHPASSTEVRRALGGS